MARILILILVFNGILAYGQSVQIDTLRLAETEVFEGLKSVKLNFPIVRSDNAEVDSIINSDMKNRLTRNEYPNEKIDSAFTKWASNRVSFLDFQVTYNQKGILSINISGEWCAAYCTQWTDYLNYSTTNGKSLEISDLIDPLEAFKARVKKERKIQYEQETNELLARLNDPQSEIDASTFDMARETYKECEEDFSLQRFSLYPDRIKIIEYCYLPHVYRSLTPLILLEYKFSEFEKELKLKN